MTDIPIIFSAPMVLALLAGRKTMTRRLLSRVWMHVEPGDRLWVRETALYWLDHANKKSKVAAYKADGYQLEPGEQWSPSIHMPRAFSRLTLIVTATKIESLHDISDDDAYAEGIEKRGERDYWAGGNRATDAIGCFTALWQSLHGLASWHDNPEVAAISFRVVKANIDAEEARAA